MNDMFNNHHVKKVIIDFEFTGLDNTYINNHEIIQVKAYDIQTGKSLCKNFSSTTPISAGAYVKTGIRIYSQAPKFSKEEFLSLCAELSIEDNSVCFFGYSISQDIKMLNKYGISIPNYFDIKDSYLLSVEYEERMSKEGSSLESLYYIVFNRLPNSNHGDASELKPIVELYTNIPNLTHKETLEFVPHGHCSGMPIQEYFSNYRKQADGYRYNNNDLFAKSLHYLEDLEWYSDNDEDC